MTSKSTKLQEDTHFCALRLLKENPEMLQRELAEAVGVSVGGMHYVLNALIDKGLVKLRKFTAAEDIRRCAYILTIKGMSEKSALTRKFRARKIEENKVLKAEIDALSAEIDNTTTVHSKSR